ncbi:Gfo/Idh/MocA family protein [Uliginosibacterium sp. H1]|uniref:Gfo/Idh/MocA family protein n=1 Tax=Uliginosibacterium sp. H1 TaxID=3114757 RepID=UPI002E196C40|nr:Gfo/Idh/MocA family oxidoreductase [Uliginosibacterium sp. H1]
MRTIRWGIIGCGEVTEVKSGPGFYKAPHSALVAVMRRDAAKAADFARRHGVARSYGDAQQLIDDPEVDAVYIATPTSSHLDYVLRVAAAGKPVYVEKPMGMDHAECQRMIAACRTAGVPLFVSLYRRALPRFLKVRELLETGAIGTPRAVSISVLRPPSEADRSGADNWRIDPAINGGGYFFDIAPHQVDLVDFLLGPVSSAWGRAGNQQGLYKAEDIVSGGWVHANGVQGTGLWSFGADCSRDEIEIVGSTGRLRFACFDNAPVELWRDGELVESFQIDHPPHVHQPLIQTINAALNDIGTCPSTGESGARAAWLMDKLVGREV